MGVSIRNKYIDHTKAKYVVRQTQNIPHSKVYKCLTCYTTLSNGKDLGDKAKKVVTQRQAKIFMTKRPNDNDQKTKSAIT